MINIIANLTAGKKKSNIALKKVEEILKSRQIDYKVHITEHAGHAIELAKQLSSEKCDLISLGGDGTVSEILNGIENFENVRFGIIPCGTGNDFALTLGISNKPEEALEKILSGETKPVDFIQFDGFRCMNVCGMGIDIDVLIDYYKHKKPNKFTYMWCLVKTLLFFKFKKFNVKIDGKDLGEREAMIVSVANGKYFGGGMMISPESIADDGFLNVIIVNKLPRRKMLKPLLSFKKGTLLKYDFVEHILCKKVEMTTNAKPMINTDGELRQAEHFSCEIVSDKLLLFR